VQSFINRATAERATAEVFASARARPWLIGLMTLGVVAAAGLAAGAIWLGAVMLAEEAKKLLLTRLSRRSKHARLALDMAASAWLAAAPAIAWFARVDMGEPLAVVMLAALVMQAAFDAKRGRMAALIACAPYGLLAYAFLFEATGDGAFMPAAMAGLAVTHIKLAQTRACVIRASCGPLRKAPRCVLPASRAFRPVRSPARKTSRRKC
jgi:hypothetical protein